MSRTRVSNASLEFLEQNLYSQALDKIYSCVDLQKIRYQLINNRVYLDNIKSSQHYITPHFQGYNFLFGFVKLNGIKYNLLIFKNLKYKKDQNNMSEIKIYKFEVTSNTLDNLYLGAGTFFDGKLIQSSSNKSSYIIHDMYMLEGKSTQNMKLEDKLIKIDQVLSRFRPIESYNFDCKVCRLYTFAELPDLIFNKIKQSDLRINGIMFLPEFSSKYYIYTNENEFDEIKSSNLSPITITKKSSGTASEVEFYMKKTSTPDVYELYCTDDDNELDTNINSITKEGIAHIPNMSTSHYFKKIFRDKNMIKVNCIKSEKFNKWVPLCDDYLDYSEAIF